MKKRTYETADILVFDPVAANRNATRAALHAIGFRSVDCAASLEAARARIAQRTPDLVLCEVAGSESEICDLVQALRQDLVGTNPFAVVIVTTWRRDGTLVGQVLNCGADDLLARPFSTGLLAERVRSHIDRRKRFVVTTDYIGPDRRRDASRSGQECIEVPNTLAIRTDAALDREAADRLAAEEVARGCTFINEEKIRRDAFQLCVQWRMLEQRRPGAREFSEILGRMERLAAEICRRASGVKEQVAEEAAVAMLESVRALGRMCRPAAGRDDGLIDLVPAMHLLGHAALTLGRIFAPGEVEPSQLIALDALIARLDVASRLERPASQALN